MKSYRTPLTITALVIAVLGLVTIWSTMPSLFITQLSFFIAGAIIVYLLSKIDINLVTSVGPFFYFASIVILLLTFLIGKNIRGSIRWIDLGFYNLQTSELVKPFLLIFYSSYLSKKKIRNYLDLLKFLGLVIIPVALVAKQPDLGSALVLLFLPLFMLIFSGQFKRLLVVGIIASVVIFPLTGKILQTACI